MSYCLREVSLDDAKILFDWRNEEECRKNSFNSELVKWEEHLKWLQKKLDSPDTEMYIFTVEGVDVGQIRLEAEDEKYIISYSVGAEYRMKGYGKRMLILAEKIVLETNPEATICADVKPDNVASQRLFEQLGYSKESMKEYYRYTK
jgi:RimJ/RimL family protein N-acetyltransferase